MRKLKPMRLQFYRTKLCPWMLATGHCRKGCACRYAHSAAELRPLPDLSKTKMCERLEKTGQCPNLERCPYAHSSTELRATHAFQKTKLCVAWRAGACTAGAFCRFAHAAEELRGAANGMTDSGNMAHVPNGTQTTPLAGSTPLSPLPTHILGRFLPSDVLTPIQPVETPWVTTPDLPSLDEELDNVQRQTTGCSPQLYYATALSLYPSTAGGFVFPSGYCASSPPSRPQPANGVVVPSPQLSLVPVLQSPVVSISNGFTVPKSQKLPAFPMAPDAAYTGDASFELLTSPLSLATDIHIAWGVPSTTNQGYMQNGSLAPMSLLPPPFIS